MSLSIECRFRASWNCIVVVLWSVVGGRATLAGHALARHEKSGGPLPNLKKQGPPGESDTELLAVALEHCFDLGLEHLYGTANIVLRRLRQVSAVQHIADAFTNLGCFRQELV